MSGWERMTTCEVVQRALWTHETDASMGSHLESCPECGTEASRAAQLRAALGSLHAELAEPPAHLYPSLLATIGGANARARNAADTAPVLQRWRRRAREVVVHPRFRGAALGAAAASAAAFAGVVLARRLARPSLAG